MLQFDKEIIVKKYLSLSSSKDISGELGLPVSKVKFILKSSLGVVRYMEIAHQIGANKVKLRLANDPVFKQKYSLNMGVSVSTSLKNLLKKRSFRKKWKNKVILASQKGNQKIRELLITDSSFQKNWIKKCKIGGRKVFEDKIGVHDPSRRLQRMAWSIKGLSKTGRKFFGPNKESMYNLLEVQVANILSKNGLNYTYEKFIKTENPNRFYYVDFFIPFGTIIEVTHWSDVDQKANLLKSKFEYLHANYKFNKFILVTYASMADRYKRVLPCYVIVLTLGELEQFIAGSGVSYSNKMNMP